MGGSLITCPSAPITRAQFRRIRSRRASQENEFSAQPSTASCVRICATIRYVRLPVPSSFTTTTPSSSSRMDDSSG